MITHGLPGVRLQVTPDIQSRRKLQIIGHPRDLTVQDTGSRRVSGESKIISKANLRKMQNHQEKRTYQSYLR